MDKQKGKEKKNHTFLKLIIALAVIGGLFFIVIQMNGGIPQLDTSYKVKTEKNTKYNGIYSLTKFEDGKNTWDGLWLYVEKDEILVAKKIELMTHEEMFKLGNTKPYMTKEEWEKSDEDKFWGYEGYVQEYIEDINAIYNRYLYSPSADNFLFPTGANMKICGFEWGRFHLLSRKQRNQLNFNSMYSDIVSCGLNSSYDEESNQLWLSKLLNNPKSEYSSDEYKLIKHTSASSIDKCGYFNGENVIKYIKQYAKNK